MQLLDTLLAKRDVPGYPGMTCELHVEDAGNYRVLVRTPVKCFEWESRDRSVARDQFFHPFVFGAEYSQHTEDDGA